MEKLINIKCYYDLSSNGKYNEVNSWSGNIVVDDDNWFIGTVSDGFSRSKMEKIICGIFLPDHGIQVFKFGSMNFSCPLVFTGTKNKDEYCGEVSSNDINYHQKCGVFKINVTEMSFDLAKIGSIHNCASYIIDNVLDNDWYVYYLNAYIYRYKLINALINHDNKELDIINHNIFKQTEKNDKVKTFDYNRKGDNIE